MALLSTEEILQQLRELKPQIIRRFRVKSIQVFGSNIRGEQTVDSDIDVLVDFEDEADLFDLSGLTIYLEEVLGKKVDVVPKGALREELQDSVYNEAIAV